MRNHFCAVVASALVLFWAVCATATPSQIFNTGLNGSNIVAPDGSFDAHYTASPGGGAQVNSSVSGTPAPDALSAWIQPFSNLGPGSYLYETTFTDTVAETVVINGQWAARDSGLDIRLNGVSNGDTIASPGYTAWHPFTITGTTVVGTNTLDFVPLSAGGPTGLRVEILSVVPEPASISIMTFASLALLSRRRR